MATPSKKFLNVFSASLNKIHLHTHFTFIFLLFSWGLVCYIGPIKSPLFFRGPSWSSWLPLFAVGLERCRARAKRQRSFHKQLGLRWSPSDWVLSSGILRHCQFCLFIDGFLLLVLRKTRRGFRLSAGHICLRFGRCGEISERENCWKKVR